MARAILRSRCWSPGERISTWVRRVAERTALAGGLRVPFHFSRQPEQAPDEAPSYPNPIHDEANGRLFSQWNRNRMISAQQIAGVPPLTAA